MDTEKWELRAQVSVLPTVLGVSRSAVEIAEHDAEQDGLEASFQFPIGPLVRRMGAALHLQGETWNLEALLVL